MRCLVVRGESEVLRFPMPTVEARLGSDPSNDLVVRIAGVSRFHARLVPDAVAPRLFDLDSKNGLRVDGSRCREVALLPGLVVHAGAAAITLEDEETADIELGLEFPRPARIEVPSPSGSDGDTDSVRASPFARETLRLLRDLDRCGHENRAGGGDGDLLERLRRLLGASTVAILRQGMVGVEPLLVCGDQPAPSTLAALTATVVSQETFRFVEIDGVEGAWCTAGRDDATVALVLLPRGSRLEPWQREFLQFGLEDLASVKSEPVGECVPPSAKRCRLAFPAGMVPGSSPAMTGLLGQIARTVHSRIDVLILGETGTGKELVARMIHESGPTPNGPFVAINCAAIPSELLEAELFGVRARVATGVDPQAGRILEASGGTLLLDEVGELPLALQPKLLRFLQEREVHSIGASRPEKVDVRVISISNRELQAESRTGRFRADLYYRLRGLQFHVPPLRDRKEDIPVLVTAFAARAAEEERKIVRGVSRKALALLEAHDWPGNIRELAGEVRRAVLFCPNGAMLATEHFGAVAWAVSTRAAVPHMVKPCEAPESLALGERVDELERDLIRKALAKAEGNRSGAARILGITRNGLALKIRRLLGPMGDRKESHTGVPAAGLRRD